MSRALLGHLWDRRDGGRLLLGPVTSFFTEHTPRNWLPSQAALLGFGPEHIDRLGGWRVTAGE
eukprot:11141213-Lingulodinium_polyedra.AAC.1